MDEQRDDAMYKMVYELHQLKEAIQDIHKRMQRVEYKVTHVAKMNGLETAGTAMPERPAFVPPEPKTVTLGECTAGFR